MSCHITLLLTLFFLGYETSRLLALQGTNTTTSVAAGWKSKSNCWRVSIALKKRQKSVYDRVCHFHQRYNQLHWDTRAYFLELASKNFWKAKNGFSILPQVDSFSMDICCPFWTITSGTIFSWNFVGKLCNIFDFAKSWLAKSRSRTKKKQAKLKSACATSA